MIVHYVRRRLAVLSVVLLSSAAAAAAECQCTTITAVVCGEDGNSFQNLCLAECQGIPVVAMGPCTAESAPSAKMAEAFHSATLQDPSLAAAMSAHYLAPLTPEQLDQVAVGAAGVVQGFDRMLPARLVTAGDMARLEKQGYVLVGALKPVNGFNPTPPPVPQDAAERPTPRVENFGATEAVATADGFLFKPKLLAKHAATVAVAAAKAAVEAAAATAQQKDETAGTVTAKTAGLVSLQPYLPKDMTAEDSGPDDVSKDAGAGADGYGPGPGPGPDPNPSDPEHHAETAAASGAASARARIGGRRRLQTVFSPDERLEMTNRQKTLVRAVGRVTFDINDRDHFCSGALIGQHTVLTAAHCVLSVNQPGLTASDWTFAPAINKWGPDPRYGRSRAVIFFFDTRFWDKDSWWLWDMAVVVLEQPLGKKTGYFGVGYVPDGYKGSLTTAGYPGDKPLWSFWRIPGGSQCVVTDKDGSDSVMTHKCDTYPGQSGSPMWIPYTRTIVGVVSWERPDTNGACAVNAFWYRFVRSCRAARPSKVLRPPTTSG